MEPDYWGGGQAPPCWIIGGASTGPPGPPGSYSTVSLIIGTKLNNFILAFEFYEIH